jgi:mono/diheme cytochrome c family protein
MPHGASLAALVAILAMASSLLGQTAGTKSISVTAVSGESWIRHLNRSFSETSMGKTWDLGPASGEDTSNWQLKLSPVDPPLSFALHGSDIYRLNCQGCHGDLGRGMPPEINSIIGPIQSTSVAATMEQMKKAGRDMSASDASALVKESTVLLMQRLHSGGESMPAPNLSDPEIHSLIPYLQQLSGLPGARKDDAMLKESPYRVGEHIVKSTCHVCHSATGANPTPQQIADGAIPPLSILPGRVGLAEFVRKVTVGAPVIMGSPAAAYRGRMPVFVYLTQDEAAAAYMYLVSYPPNN